jgi:hypothetical protein
MKSLDLSKLSPICSHKILVGIQKQITDSLRDLKEDIKQYDEGQVKQEFQGWIDACYELLGVIHEIQYPRKKDLTKAEKTI